MSNLLRKLIFDQVFYVTIADTDIERLKSLHTLFDKYLDHMLVKFEKKNRMVQTIQNIESSIELFDVVTPILEDVSVTKTIV